jgi:hypothetical protein
MSESGPSPDLEPLVAAIQTLTEEIAKLREAVESGTNPVVARVAASSSAAESAAVDVKPIVSSAASDAIQTAVDQTLVFLFSAAMTPNEEDGFDAFVAVMHSSRTDAPLAVQNLRQFSWKALQKNLGTYLKDPYDPTSFTVVRREPRELEDSVTSIKLYLGGTRPSDTPVNLRKDDAAGGVWRVTDSSL